MPIYEYVCNACGYDFERIQSFSAEPLTECPECAGRVRRVISPAGVIFKGSGWYITDSRRQLTGKKDKPNGKGGDKDASKDGGTAGSDPAGSGGEGGAAGAKEGTPSGGDAGGAAKDAGAGKAPGAGPSGATSGTGS